VGQEDLPPDAIQAISDLYRSKIENNKIDSRDFPKS